MTLEFMERAQERAYRTIAPRLKDAIEKELPEITGGRYVEATVDPESLDVNVWGNGGAPDRLTCCPLAPQSRSIFCFASP